MGQPLNHMLHMLCIDISSAMLLFSLSLVLIARVLAHRI